MNAQNQQRPLLTPQELSWLLNRHPNYVYLMRKAGFPMPGYRATLDSALKWLEENPNWRRRVTNPSKKRVG